MNDNSHADNWGHVPSDVPFWQSSDQRVQIIRHCEGVFSLECEGILVMPPTAFEAVSLYVASEFPVDGVG